MMNSADQQDKENTSLPKLPGMFRNNEAHNSLPPELQAARNIRKEQFIRKKIANHRKGKM